MNDPEVAMRNAIPSTGLAAQSLALEAAGAVNRSAAQTALDDFDRVRAMTWRLLNPKA